jgi:quercetin dioxygenase-like cupin family protein
MNLPTFDEFKNLHTKQGCSEVISRDWQPNQIVAAHTHPFTADALIVQGEMWLTVGDNTQHLRVGDTFHLKPHTLHSERYGHEGATYWVARTNA